ncbi:MAG: sugar phosphate isomerase/epimerase [Planctomycetota bacterium]|nr:MAG: sugar phosphate isomerase/epimerase [Planctomycetota bacterium]
MKPALGTVCSLDAKLGTIVADYAAGHCDHVDLWLGHAEQYLEAHSPEALRELFQIHAVQPLAASYQGGLLTAQGDARREHWALFEHRLELCQGLGIPVLVLAGDAFGPLSPTDLGRLSSSLTESARRAADSGVRLALEFDARATFPNNLQSAVALVEDVGHPGLGLCLDWYHYSVGPSKPLDLRLLSAENLAHVQLSDIADVPREMASDADRILPGEGAAPPDDLLRRLAEISYAGGVAVELMNPALWRVPPRQFGEVATTALRRLLGQADMGFGPRPPEPSPA